MRLMGRRAAENQVDDDDLRERGSQRRKEEREWRADATEQVLDQPADPC